MQRRAIRRLSKFSVTLTWCGFNLCPAIHLLGRLALQPLGVGVDIVELLQLILKQIEMLR